MERPLSSLLDLQHVVRSELRQALSALDLTPVQNTVLHMVDGSPGSSSAELARRTHVTPQTMHKLVTELEHRGLLTLQARPGHGRTLNAHLTDQGRGLLTESDRHAQTLEDRMTKGLDKQQRRALDRLLQHCITALDRPPEEA